MAKPHVPPHSRRFKAYLLYNWKDEKPKDLIDKLNANGIEILSEQPGETATSYLQDLYREQLNNVSAVIAWFGKEGWTDSHLSFLQLARNQKLRVIPVVNTQEGELRVKKYTSLLETDSIISVKDSAGLEQLVQTIRNDKYTSKLVMSPAQITGDFSSVDFSDDDFATSRSDDEQASVSSLPTNYIEFNPIIEKLVNGNDTERAEIQNNILSNKHLNKTTLSHRLRIEIQSRFSPTQSHISSEVRSWMLATLILIDAEGIESSRLIQYHLSPSVEPSDNVRFWVLANLYWKKASYLRENNRSCRLDPSKQVSRLAIAIGLEENPSELKLLKSDLENDDPNIIRPVLRALRFVPVTELVEPVCKMLVRATPQTRISYDILYALANPQMAQAAVKPLTQLLGIDELVNRVIHMADLANPIALRNFSSLLAAFEKSKVLSALAEARNSPSAKQIADSLIKNLKRSELSSPPPSSYLPGYHPDTTPIAKDQLDIQEDVRTLTAVMLARDVTPPLAIGLFGDWGTGKSYFMKSMQQATQSLTHTDKATDTSPYCTNILEIEFNAWHYADANLWASLANVIFKRLADHSHQQLSPQTEHEVLDFRLNEAQKIIADNLIIQQQAEAEITSLQTQLAALERAREEKKVSIWQLQPSTLAELLKDEPDLQHRLAVTSAKIGLPAAYDSIAELTQVTSDVRTTWGKLCALAYSLWHSKSRYLLLALITFIIIGIPTLTTLLHQHFPEFVFSKIASWVSQFTAAVLAIIALIGRAMTKVNAGIEAVTKAKQKADVIIAAAKREKSAEENTISTRISELENRRNAVGDILTNANNEIIFVEAELSALKDRLSLAYFLKERSRSEEFSKHLGIITDIRRNFEELTKRLIEARSDEAQKAGAVERIILYIDDLDRCSSKTVLDVLEAIHLLLAYELFVVVVGVDPTWLNDSLTKNHTIFQSNNNKIGSSTKLRQPTPQKYLEKIFQIPFCLRPMSENGFGRLIGNLLASPPKNRSTVTGVPSSVADPNTTDSDLAPANGSTSTSQPSSLLAPEPGSLPIPEFTVSIESLSIQPWESAFAENLFAFIPSPRAAKRFANIYRLLKAPLYSEDLAQFEGNSTLPGDFQLPMLLLALLIGRPDVADMLFPRLQESADTNQTMQDAWQIPTDLLESDALTEHIQQLVGRPTFPIAPALYHTWLPRVARFSFTLGHVVRPLVA